MLQPVLLFLVVFGSAFGMSCEAGWCYFEADSCPLPSAPASIHSFAQNSRASSQVTSQSLLGGYIYELSLTWMDESTADFSPLNFNPNTDGFVSVNSEGAWSVVPFSTKLPYICRTVAVATTTTLQPSTDTSTPLQTTNGETTSTTNTPFTTQIVRETTTIESSTSESSTSESPTETLLTPPNSTLTPLNVSGTPQTTATNSTTTPSTTWSTASPSTSPPTTNPPASELQLIASTVAGFFPQEAISVTAFTLNSVDVAIVSPNDSVTLLSYLALDVLLSVVVGCNTSVAGIVSSISFDPVTKKISFAVPTTVVSNANVSSYEWVSQYELCVGVMGSNSSTLSNTKTTLVVKSLVTSLLGASNTVTLREEDATSLSERLFRLPLAVDDSFKTLRLSPSVLTNVALRVAFENRQIGASCVGLESLLLQSFVIGKEVAFVVSADTVTHLWQTQKGSVCASSAGSGSVVVSSIAFEVFSAVSSSSTLSVNRGGDLISIRGIYAASMISGSFNSTSAFVSSTVACDAPNDDFQVDLRPILLNSSSTSSSNILAVNVSQALLLVTTSSFDTTSPFYVCLSWNKKKAVVKFNDEVALTLSSPTPDSSTLDLKLVDGSAGWVDLRTHVLPAQTAAEIPEVQRALAFLNAGGSVHFLSANSLSEKSQKDAACAAMVAVSTIQVSGGLCFLTASQLPASAIVCSSEGTFLRVSSTVLQVPTTVFSSFNGVRFVAPDAGTSLTSAILLPLSLRLDQLSLCVASSSLGCTSNSTFPIASTINGSFYAVIPSNLSLPQTVSELFIGTGVDSQTQAGSFVSTGAFIRFGRFSSSLDDWKAAVGLALPWTLTTSEALCGNGNFPFALPIENGIVLPSVQMWPRAYEIVLSQMGTSAITVSISGVQVPIVVVKGLIFAFGPLLSTESMCISISPLRLLSGRVQTGIASVATLRNPILTMQRSNLYTGLLLSLIASTEATCASAGATGHSFMFTSYEHLETSGIDLAPLLWVSKFSYFKVCYAVHGQWVGPVPNTFILTTFAPGPAAASWVNFIDNQNSPTERTLWESQQVSWFVYGIFPSVDDTNVFVVLAWDDQTCVTAAQNAAIVVPVTILSAKSGRITIDVDSIQGSGTNLFPCYIGDNSTLAWPMTLEAVYGNHFVVRSLSVSQLQYSTTIAVGSHTTDLFLQLTDAAQAPVTEFSVYVASSATDYQATGGCSTLKAEHIGYFEVSVDSFGQRWMIVPASFLQQTMPSSDDAHAYFVMCATAATDLSSDPHFQPVFVSLDVTGAALIPHNYNMLVIEFSNSVNVSVGDAALAEYTGSIVTSALPNNGYSIGNISKVLTKLLPRAANGLLQVAIYIAPVAIVGTDVAGADDLTGRVYNAMASGDCSTLMTSNGSLSVNSASLHRVFNYSFVAQPSVACGSAAGTVQSGTTSFVIFGVVVLAIGAVLVTMSLKNQAPVRSPAPGEQQATSMKPRAVHDSVLVSPSPRKPDFEEGGFHAEEASLPQPDLTMSPVKPGKTELASPNRRDATTRPVRVDTPASPQNASPTAQQPLGSGGPTTQQPLGALPSSVTLRAPVAAAIPIIAPVTVSADDDRDPLHDEDDSDGEYTSVDF